MPIGLCAVCDEPLDLSDAGICESCGNGFCWGECGGWHGLRHACSHCQDPYPDADADAEDDETDDEADELGYTKDHPAPAPVAPGADETEGV